MRPPKKFSGGVLRQVEELAEGFPVLLKSKNPK
jgi:hypothetical protein